ncbi:hypothetical protein LTR85_010805 [Meristemomyces frigidus]|nr:hypothetical protein LTR85_010805 [Meristemomyces frigidus]
MTGQAQRCRLLELPPELRDAIFEFALTSDKTLVTFRLDTYQRDSYTQATQPPLTRVSRQLRHESIPIYYAANDFVLHTEGIKAENARRWLECNERYLLRLRRVSLWVRYASSTNAGSSSQGALSVGMKRDVAAGCWKVDDDWRWITVLRKPAALERDAEFLIQRLRSLLVNESTSYLNAEGFVGLMLELRGQYVKEKIG